MKKVFPSVGVVRKCIRGRNQAHVNTRNLGVALWTEQLETRLMLTGVEFLVHLPSLDGHVAELTSVDATDLDRDGDIDILSASAGDNKIAWYENVDGLGTFGPQRTITTAAAGARAVLAADVDGDGDHDVLSASQDDDKIAWYENLDGRGTFGAQRIISASSPRVQSIASSDIDGDGDIDVVSASRDDNTIAWYENMDGLGTFGSKKAITMDLFGASTVHADDLDNDGDVDVMGASLFDGKLVWFENADGNGTFGSERVITSQLRAPRGLNSADVDGDGDVDVIAASEFDHKITWYENVDGEGEFGPERTITRAARKAQAVFPADVDGDNDLDVVSASLDDGRVTWHENTDGQGSFRSRRIVMATTGEARAVIASDVNGDGRVDVVVGDTNSIVWYRNDDSGRAFDDGKVIATSSERASSIATADVDGDNDRDVIAVVSSRAIAWYENVDGSGIFAHRKVFATEFLGGGFVEAVDLDGDNDLDLLALSTGFFFGGLTAWLENIDGSGSFGPTQSIGHAASAVAADFDQDNDVDILVPHGEGDEAVVGWYANDGLGSFGPLNEIAVEGAGLGIRSIGAIAAADLDADGDLDIIVEENCCDSGSVSWHENIDQKLGPARVIDSQQNGGVSGLVGTVDLDGDQDLDIVVTQSSGIMWYENADGAGTFRPQRLIARRVRGDRDVNFADVDRDGDVDVVSGSRFPDKFEIYWHENTDGKGSFASEVLIASVHGARAFVADDIDGDGDTDVLAMVSDGLVSKVAWIENTTPRAEPGDANRDWQFDQADIVQVLQANKYLEVHPANWKEGDWNGDSLFDQLDIVAALQTGNYLQGPHAAVGSQRLKT